MTLDPHSRLVLTVMGITALLWLIYLSMMMYEHRKVLKEMGASLR